MGKATEAEVRLGGQVFHVDLSSGKTIARTVCVVETEGPLVPGAIDVQSALHRDGGFVGGVSVGGACKVGALKINPHCCGTQVEALMHVMPFQEVAANSTIDSVVPSRLQLVLETCSAAEAMGRDESSTGHAHPGDRSVSAVANQRGTG